MGNSVESIIRVGKPEGFHEIQRLCSKNQLITSLYKMLTILFVLNVIHFQVFHLTEKLSRITLYEYTVCCNYTGFIFDLDDMKQGQKKDFEKALCLYLF